jgi:hypothetical protein
VAWPSSLLLCAPASRADSSCMSGPDTIWPRHDHPSWPRRCLVENAAVHPHQPWLAVACTDAAAELGAVLVFDALTGGLRSTTVIDGFVGWSNRHLLRWHPDGARLGTNVNTNGIGLVDRGEFVGAAFPDETRDGGVGYVWIGDEMFTDTGALFRIQPGDWRFDFAPLDMPELQAIEWNPTGKFVVGRVGSGIAAFDPIAQRLVYEQALTGPGDGGTPDWSPDGRWCVRREFAAHPASDRLLFVDGDTGRVHGVRTPSSPRIDEIVWSPDGALAVSGYVHHVGGARTDRRVDIFRGGERRTTIELGARAIQASHGIADACGIAWSPAGDGLALLLDGQHVQIHDAHTGRVLAGFDAPAPPIPAGLPDHYTNADRPDFGRPGDLMWTHQQRILRIAPHFVAVWSMDGSKLAEFVVPT